MIHIDYADQVGPAIKAIRGIHGIGRRELARRMSEVTGTAPHTLNQQLWNWETSRHNPTLDSAVAALTALGYRLEIVPLEEA